MNQAGWRWHNRLVRTYAKLQSKETRAQYTKVQSSFRLIATLTAETSKHWETLHVLSLDAQWILVACPTVRDTKEIWKQ